MPECYFTDIIETFLINQMHCNDTRGALQTRLLLIKRLPYSYFMPRRCMWKWTCNSVDSCEAISDFSGCTKCVSQFLLAYIIHIRL